MQARQVLCVFYQCCVFFSNTTLNDYGTELNWTLLHVRKWARFENWSRKYGMFPPRKREALIFGLFHNDIQT